MAGSAYDVLLKHGRVIDPANNVDEILDIAVKDGVITAVEREISPAHAVEVFDADGYIVTPGLIDSHVHCYEYATPLGINPDRDCLSRGVTTIVDCGSAGASTFPGLRHFIAEQSKTRVLCLLHIAAHGLAAAGCSDMTGYGECDSIKQLDENRAVACVEKNRDMIVGIKIRLSADVMNDGQFEEEAYRRALSVATRCQLPLMAHHSISTIPVNWIEGQSMSCPGSLRQGDIYTHALHGYDSCIVNPESGSLFPEVLEAQKRGIFFDVGHGESSFSWAVAEQCAKENFWCDLAGSDLHTGNVHGPAYDLPTVMSKLLHLGMPLNDVIKTATSNPAKAFGVSEKIGSLGVGREADITVLCLKPSAVDLPDCHGEVRKVSQLIVPVAVWRKGVKHGITSPKTLPR